MIKYGVLKIFYIYIVFLNLKVFFYIQFYYGVRKILIYKKNVIMFICYIDENFKVYGGQGWNKLYNFFEYFNFNLFVL